MSAMSESILSAVVMGFGGVITVFSAWGVLAPGRLVDMVMQFWAKPGSLWFAVLVRLVLGLVLLAAAGASRFPEALFVLGWLAIIAAIVLLIIGKQRLSSLMEWIATRPRWFMSAWCLLGVGFGVFLVYSVA